MVGQTCGGCMTLPTVYKLFYHDCLESNMRFSKFPVAGGHFRGARHD